MKGTYFARPLEFQISVEGESWVQGSLITGTLICTNHSLDEISCENFGVQLALGDFKKIKARDEKAFKSLMGQNMPATLKVGGKKKAELNFSFQLDINAPITDKKASLYLCYGNLNEVCGQLQLAVGPRPIFSSVIEIADIFLRFQCKETKYSEDKVLFKLTPPESKEFLGLEEVILQLQTQADNVHADYEFKHKTLGVESGLMKINKKTKQISQVWGPKDIFLGKDIPNQDKILALLKQAVGSHKPPSI